MGKKRREILNVIVLAFFSYAKSSLFDFLHFFWQENIFSLVREYYLAHKFNANQITVCYINLIILSGVFIYLFIY